MLHVEKRHSDNTSTSSSSTERPLINIAQWMPALRAQIREKSWGCPDSHKKLQGTWGLAAGLTLAGILSMLGDFDLLDLLTERSTITGTVLSCDVYLVGSQSQSIRMHTPPWPTESRPNTRHPEPIDFHPHWKLKPNKSLPLSVRQACGRRLQPEPSHWSGIKSLVRKTPSALVNAVTRARPIHNDC